MVSQHAGTITLLFAQFVIARQLMMTKDDDNTQRNRLRVLQHMIDEKRKNSECKHHQDCANQ